MKRIVPAGVKNGTNTVYTLGEVSVTGALTFCVVNGQLLAQVPSSPNPTQCILSGASLTLGFAPVTLDDIAVYIQTSLEKGLVETPILGIRSFGNVAYQLGTAPPAGSHALIFYDGLLLNQVSSAPTPQQVIVSGTALTFGLAPLADTLLKAYIEDPLSLSFLRALPMQGLQSRWSASFATSQSFSPILAVFINGVLQELTTTLPNPRQYQIQALASQISLTLGIELVTQDDLQVFILGMSASPTRGPSLSVYGRLIDELLVLMNERIDHQEAKMCLNRRWQKILNAWTWSFAKADGVLSTKAPKTAGTVRVTQDSVSVTGAGTAFATTDIGEHIVLDTQPYRLLDVQVISATQQVLIIDAPYPGTTTAALTYQLYYKEYALDPDVVDIFTMASTDRGWGEMEEMNQQQLNQYDWYRTTTGPPSHYIRRGMTSGVYQVELWPVPDARYTIRYVAITRSMLDQQGDFLPDVHELLLMAAEEMACGIVASKCAAEKDYQGAQFWVAKGEGRMTHYEESLLELKSKDRHAFGKNTRPGGPGGLNSLAYGWGRWDQWGS